MQLTNVNNMMNESKHKQEHRYGQYTIKSSKEIKLQWFSGQISLTSAKWFSDQIDHRRSLQQSNFKQLSDSVTYCEQWMIYRINSAVTKIFTEYVRTSR